MINKTRCTIAVLSVVCCAGATATDINRQTFRMSVPDNWRESSKGDGQFIASFATEDFCSFSVAVEKKPNRIPRERAIQELRKKVAEILIVRNSTDIHKWHDNEGSGFEVEGWFDRRRYKVRFFIFENQRYVCCITEWASGSNWQRYGKVFDAMGRSFRLK